MRVAAFRRGGRISLTYNFASTLQGVRAGVSPAARRPDREIPMTSLQVPANRIGFAGGILLAQLKILQEVITLVIFVPFAMLYMDQPFKLDYVWAALCLLGAVYFIFR